MSVEEVFFCCFTFLMLWVGRWSTFSCVSCFILDSGQMRYLNFYGEAKKFKNMLSYHRFMNIDMSV